jgi:hypothetical protein
MAQTRQPILAPNAHRAAAKILLRRLASARRQWKPKAKKRFAISVEQQMSCTSKRFSPHFVDKTEFSTVIAYDNEGAGVLLRQIIHAKIVLSQTLESSKVATSPGFVTDFVDKIEISTGIAMSGKD